MTVDPAITRAIVEHELAQADAWESRGGWSRYSEDWNALCFVFRIESANPEEAYFLEAHLDGYREQPPALDFIDPATGRRGEPSLYPKSKVPNGGDIFHPRAIICHPSNRLCYKEHTGLHGEWNIGAWESHVQDGVKNLRTILMMIATRIRSPQLYAGRMAA